MTNNNMFDQLATFLQNPSKFIQNQMGISGEIANNPDAIIEKMMAEDDVEVIPEVTVTTAT